MTSFLSSDERWLWLQGNAFAGKSALLAWFALHPPPDVDVAACFLRRTTDEADATTGTVTITSTLTALYLGVTGQDYVGPSGQLSPDGVPDWHIQLQGLRGIPIRVLHASPVA